MQESKQLSRQDTGPHTFQPSNANDHRKKWFPNPKSTANSYKVECLV